MRTRLEHKGKTIKRNTPRTPKTTQLVRLKIYKGETWYRKKCLIFAHFTFTPCFFHFHESRRHRASTQGCHFRVSGISSVVEWRVTKNYEMNEWKICAVTKTLREDDVSQKKQCHINCISFRINFTSKNWVWIARYISARLTDLWLEIVNKMLVARLHKNCGYLSKLVMKKSKK